jgi:hypothetical protein
MNGPLPPREKLLESLEALIAPGDRIARRDSQSATTTMRGLLSKRLCREFYG